MKSIRQPGAMKQSYSKSRTAVKHSSKRGVKVPPNSRGSSSPAFRKGRNF